MKVERIVVGFLQTNCYLLFKEDECLIIDPGAEGHKIVKEIKDYKVKGILVTHCHPDHIGSVDYLKNYYDCLVYDYENLEEGNYKVGKFNFDVIFTPGHSYDSLSYYFFNKHLFTGDFLFKGTIGRYDLPTSDYNALMNSLDKIRTYPQDIIVYPGHGEQTTLGQELMFNPYFK